MAGVLFYSEAWGRGGIETFVRNVMPAVVGAGWEAEVFSTWDWGEGPDPALEGLRASVLG